MKQAGSWVGAAVILLVIVVNAAVGQPHSPTNAHWNPQQLDQLTAPISLYPDPLLGSILAASTYPLEVVEAERWLEDPAHAALKGEELAAALQAQSWDPSVKSLVPFPDVLRFMDTNLEWTEQLGDAFLAQQGDVMDAVQRLRQRAVSQGTLRSTPQQTVSSDQNAISIEPTDPDVVYVPYYVPAVYGPWPWPDYPPYAFAIPADVYLGDGFIGFGIGIGFGFFEPWWGWYGCNWPGRGVWIYPPYGGTPGNPPRPYPIHPRGQPQPWQHDPQHRGGVPYRDAATAARYLGADAVRQRAFRGFPEGAPAPRTGPNAMPETRPMPETHAPPSPPPVSAPAPMPRPSFRPEPPAPRASPPAFESFGRGPQVRTEAARGSMSRSAPSAPARGSSPGRPH